MLTDPTFFPIPAPASAGVRDWRHPTDRRRVADAEAATRAELAAAEFQLKGEAVAARLAVRAIDGHLRRLREAAHV